MIPWDSLLVLFVNLIRMNANKFYVRKSVPLCLEKCSTSLGSELTVALRFIYYQI